MRRSLPYVSVVGGQEFLETLGGEVTLHDLGVRWDRAPVSERVLLVASQQKTTAPPRSSPTVRAPLHGLSVFWILYIYI